MRAAAAPIALYCALTVALTWPLVVQPASLLPSDLVDPGLNAWLLWWNAQAIPLTDRWWNAPMFFPAAETMTFSEHLLGLTWLTTPLHWLGAPPIAVYNVAWLLSFALSALGAHLLTYHLTGRTDAALVAGLAFGFAPYRIAQIGHLQVLTAYWMPVALLALHRFLEDRRQRWLVLFATAWVLQATSNLYFLLYFSVLVCAWIAWFVSRRWACLRPIAVAWSLVCLPMIPILLSYRRVHARFGFARPREEIEFFSADLTSLLDGSPNLAFWQSPIAFHNPEGELYPGLTVVLLLVAALVIPGRRAEGNARWWLPRTLVAVLGALVLLLGVSALVLGRWSFTWLGIPVAITGGEQLVQALLLLGGLAVTSPRIWHAWTHRSAFAFYGLAAGMTWVLSLGPRPRFLGDLVWDSAPYAWLMWLPGFDNAVRVPARFWMVAALCVAVTAGLALPRLVPRTGLRAWMLVGCLSVGIVADGWAKLPFVDIPRVADVLDGVPTDEPVLELPAAAISRDTSAMLRSTTHGHPVVNGVSGYKPPHIGALREGLAARDPEVLSALTTLTGGRPLLVLIDRHRDLDDAWAAYVRRAPGAAEIATNEDWRLIRVPARIASSPERADFLPIARVEGSGDGTEEATVDVLASVTDGNLGSRWDSGRPQLGTEVVTLELAQAQVVSGIVLSLGPSVNDFPRELRIEASIDGEEWEPVWHGKTAGPTVRGGIVDPLSLPVRIDFPPRRTRRLRLRQLGRSEVYFWSIAELAVLGGA